MSEENRCIAVIRIRGNVGTSKEIEEILRQMHLTRKNHATLFHVSPSNKGLLKKVKDYVTWGAPSLKVVTELIVKRGMLPGNKKLTDEYAKESLGYDSLTELAKALYEVRVHLKDLKGVKPLFRLHPPRKGFRGSTKKPYREGELGGRGEEISRLLARMV